MKLFNLYETMKSLRDLNINFNSITDSPDLSIEYLELGLGLKDEFFKKSVDEPDHTYMDNIHRGLDSFGLDLSTFRYIFSCNLDTKFSDIIYRTYTLHPDWRVRVHLAKNKFISEDLLVLLSNDFDFDTKRYAEIALGRFRAND